MKPRGKYVLLSIVMLVLGYLIAFSYQLTNETKQGSISAEQWNKEYESRQLLINQEEKNLKLQEELSDKQKKVQNYEEMLKKDKQAASGLVDEIEKLRMYVGETGVKGKGVQITLEDSSYIPANENANNYIVHESHIFKVINELLISGASAVAINGQRVSSDSYIFCNGPVITVDGNQFPAPFVISAIGDPEVMIGAFTISGGVSEELVYDNIVVKSEKKNEITMNPMLQGDRKS
ncbi:DUF881 domain-containing protein [Bacillus sp. FJAT-42376]|uniref:DUF881 domain-containing protein n=1 Tax=Bacillus sp. FJAT-42376 TaxID=2014076 RepID=UPI000F4FAB84|nr:DUF881 domain-containing protein [Bacillus sp. FJAT-42376]AZB42843.1 DUF881 domain-containing protein [Bacillus sp. FJAT-42376]